MEQPKEEIFNTKERIYFVDYENLIIWSKNKITEKTITKNYLRGWTTSETKAKEKFEVQLKKIKKKMK